MRTTALLVLMVYQAFHAIIADKFNYSPIFRKERRLKESYKSPLRN